MGRIFRIRLEEKKEVHGEIYDAEAELWNSLDGPVFHCSMLVGTTCEDTCDWQKMAEDEGIEYQKSGILKVSRYPKFFIELFIALQ